MGDFFDDISKRAQARRNLSFEKQKTLLNSGILTPSMTNDSLDGNLTDEQIVEKKDMIEAEEQQAYNDAIGVPFGVVEGAAGILGDVELLGQGIKGAYNADRGQKWDGFVEGLQDRDTQFWTTQDNMERTDRWLEGTGLGDRLKDGSGGRLLGEVLAPIPVPKGVMQAGKIGAKIATHPMTRYTVAKAANEVENFTQGGRGMLDSGMGGMKPYNPLKLPQSNMVIGQGSSKFDMPTYNEFKKQIDVEKVMESRKKNNSVLPTKEEQRLWDLTAKKGNPTFIDIDGVIKQEIPTGAMNLKAPLKLKPAKILENDSLASYNNMDKNLSVFKMSKAQERLGYDAYIQGDKVGVNVSNVPDYQKPRWANDDLSTQSHLADKNKIDTFLAHEGQHGIQDAETANKWATGSDMNALFSEGIDKVIREGKKAKAFKKKQLEDGVLNTPGADAAINRADAAQQMIDNGMMSPGSLKNNIQAMRNYFFDRGEIGARTTQGRVNYDKDAIARDHYLNAMQDGLDRLDKNGNLRTPDANPVSYNDLPNQDLLEQFKSGIVRDRSVIDELNKDELGKMLDDEAVKGSASNFKQAIKDTVKKRKHPKVLQKGGFKINDIGDTMGHGYEVKFTMDGSDWSFGIPSTPRNPEGAVRNILHNVGKFFTKGSDWYLDKDLADIIVKPGDDVSRELLSNAKASKRTSYSMPNPDAKLFDDLDEGVIPKNRQNQVTKLVKSPLGTEIEKPLGYRGDPMLDSDWDNSIFSSQKPGTGRDEVVAPMNNVLDANGNITQQPSTGLNSEAISNMNPMEVARGQGIRGYAELKEELRALYKEATGDPAMQKQIRDKIVEVDKQMNMFDADVAKPRKSIYEESTGFNDEGDEVLRHSNPEDAFTNRSRTLDYEQALQRDLTNDSNFTGKGALPNNPNTISDISINAGGTPTAPVMVKAADKKLVKSITNSINNMRRSPDETINEILRHISDLESKPVPKQARLAEADKVAKDKMLKYAYEAIESIQRNSYMGTDIGNVAKVPTGALDNIGVQTAETYVPKVDKPRFDNPQDYEFDEMLRSWDKEAQNIKTRERYLPNGKRLNRSKLRDHEDPVKGSLPDYGRGRVK